MTTDAVVRSVTVIFKFGEKVQESTVGREMLLSMNGLRYHKYHIIYRFIRKVYFHLLFCIQYILFIILVIIQI